MPAQDLFIPWTIAAFTDGDYEWNVHYDYYLWTEPTEQQGQLCIRGIVRHGRTVLPITPPLDLILSLTLAPTMNSIKTPLNKHIYPQE